MCLRGLAAVAVPTQPERAARLFSAAEALCKAMGSPRVLTIEHSGYDHEVGAPRAHLREEAFAAAWAEGRAMSLDEAAGVALEENPAASDQVWPAGSGLTDQFQGEHVRLTDVGAQVVQAILG